VKQLTNMIEFLSFSFLMDMGATSRLRFLKYINDDNDERHKWNVCVSVPHGTLYCWQVDDLAGQNGFFKRALSWAKTELLEKKES